MKTTKKAYPIKIIVFIVIAIVLLFLIGWGARNSFGLYKKIQLEANATPTPSADIRSVMAVTPDPSAPTPSPTPMLLKNGSEGEDVLHLQKRLEELGYYKGTADGQFGPGTKEAVIWFQSQHQLHTDGLVGPDTLAMINSSQAQQALSTSPPEETENPSSSTEIFEEMGSFPLLVNKENPLGEEYLIKDLVYLTDYLPESLVKIKYSDTQGSLIAIQALEKMFTAAHHQGIALWQVSAGYRSTSQQQALLDDKVSAYKKEGFSSQKALSAAKQTVALPGTSEHHTGLAFDITVPGESFKNTKQSKWLNENCWDYGFIIRYQEDKEKITGFLAEPWHVRYVGVEHSLPMKEQNLALEEYLTQQEEAVIFIQ